MAAKIIEGKKRKVSVKKMPSVRRGKKSKATSAVVLVLHGSTALRRRKSAEKLAETLQVELFRVDVSAVVSKYIAETEKNLNDVFDKAETSGSILFFDEADALFGGRTTVNDSHDRFVDPETAHFLHRIEQHHGIVIMTTNGTRRIEQAFLTQMRVVVMVGAAGTRRKRTR
jgi:SpoVK/Ycf46/Vps4 family AAA+-type ATPase